MPHHVLILIREGTFIKAKQFDESLMKFDFQDPRSVHSEEQICLRLRVILELVKCLHLCDSTRTLSVNS